MFDVDKISDFEEPTTGGPSQWQHSIEVSAVKEEYAAAMQVAESSLAEYKKGGNKAGEAAALHAKAKVSHAKGNHDEAKEAAEGALEKYRAAGDAKGEAGCLHTLSRLHLDSKKVDEAEKTEALEQSLKVATEALELFKGMSDKNGQAAVSNTMAKVQFASGMFDEAQESSEKAYMLFQDVGDKNGQASALLSRSLLNLFWGAGNWEEAGKLAKQAIDLCKEVTKPSAQHREADAWLMVCAASIPLLKGPEALSAAKNALTLMETLGGDYKLVLALRALAFTQAVTGNVDEAMSHFDRAKTLAGAIQDKYLNATVAITGSVVQRVKMWGCKNAGKPLGDADQKAVALGREAVGIFTEMDDLPSAALSRVELAQAMLVAGNVGEGLGEATSAKDFFESLGNQAGEAIALLTMAEGLQMQGGQTEAAYACAKRAQELFTKAGGAGEGTKAAGEMLDVLEGELRQKRETGSWGAIDHGTFTGEDKGFGGISRSTYTRLFAQTMYMPDRPYEVMLDAPLIQGMEAVMASMARQATQKPKAAPARARGGGGEGGRDAPTRGEGQQLRPVPLKEPERLVPPVVRDTVIGSDQLGGRSWDCPEDVHLRMLELAARGAIPVTKPEQRGKNMNKRPTFYGAPEWKDAVKMGYIHPDVPAPRGMKWRKVTMGWKLLEA
mmetsp:Transcript_47809/g.138215  ORF Transcript_47809/g.138215 Transcript_47809/m.138215 type:complete len:668 (+) Transcript_47809:78-2081(+)